MKHLWFHHSLKTSPLDEHEDMGMSHRDGQSHVSINGLSKVYKWVLVVKYQDRKTKSFAEDVFEKKINLGIASCRKVKKLVGNSTIWWENGQKKSATMPEPERTRIQKWFSA